MDRSRHLCVLLSLILFHASEVCSQFSFKQIAVTDLPTRITVPGQPGLVMMSFTALSNPVVFDSGQIAYSGSVNGPAGIERGLWAGAIQIAKENSTLPINISGTRRATIGSPDSLEPFGPLKLLNGAYVTFRSRLKAEGVTELSDTALYRWSGGDARLNVREGDPFDSNDSFTVGDLFEISDTVQETALTRIPLLAEGAPGPLAVYVAPGFVQEGSRLYRPGSLGEVRPLGLGLSSGALLRPSHGEVQIVTFEPGDWVAAHTGETFGDSNPVEVTRIYHPGLAFSERQRSFSRAVFGARLSGPGVDESNDSAVLMANTSETSLILREGVQAPGRAAGVLIGDLGTDNIVGGGHEQFLLNAQLVGPGVGNENDWALSVWSGATKSGRILAQEGQLVSGLPGGSILAGLDAPHFQFNLNGETIFNAQLVGASGNGDGLFYANIEELEPRLIVRTGQEFDIGGGVFKTISDIGLLEMSNPWDGRASQINDAGQIAFDLTFSDGSQGIFVASIPEPESIALAVVAGVIVIWASRRRCTARC